MREMSVGETVRVRYGKWGGGRHYEFDMSRLGEDDHGVWLAAPEGTEITRPGYTFTSSTEWVVCFAHTAGWTASFHPHDRHDIATYVDITTVPEWTQGEAVSMVDLDLDVVQRVDGELLVDDEDEFAEHKVSLGYPGEVVDHAESTCRAVLEAMAAGAEPFGSVGQSWLSAYTAALDGATTQR